MALDLLVVAQGHPIRRLVVGVEDEFGSSAPRPYTHLAQSAGALLDREEVAEQVETVDERVATRSDEVPPARLRAALPHGHFHQPEIRRLPVGPDDPAAVEVIGVIFVVALPRQQHAEIEPLVRRFGVALFALDRALRMDEEVAPILARADVEVESVVRLLVDEDV